VDALDMVKTWPVGTAAVAVVKDAGVAASAGPDTPLPWASVTLDDPAGPPGSTVRHLLAHASGIGPADDSVLSKPGRRRIYSNRGYEVLADLVADRTGTSFADLMDASVLRPLGMTATALAGSPASGARGPIGDLSALGRELLAPTLVPELIAAATRTAFPGLSGVLPGFGRQDPNDWGLGFEIRDGKAPHWTGSRNSPETFGHFGQAGGFLWVDPVAGLACACLTDRSFGEWAAQAWPPFSDQVLQEFAG
jgi:CubicO group peptidase (beta-lactamase class C family)